MQLEQLDLPGGGLLTVYLRDCVETMPQAMERPLVLVVPCEAHLFEKGCHGTSLSTAEVNHPSAHRSRWLTLAREWLDDTFDFHLGTGETGG